MAVSLKIDKENKKANFKYSIPKHMQECYNNYMQCILEDGAYIVDDCGEHIKKSMIVGYLDISFHDNMYDIETNITFMEDIKANLESICNGIII